MEKEAWVYISGDGVEYPLDVDGKRTVLTSEGTGIPEIKYISKRGPYQDGDSISAYRLEPRIVQLLIRHNFCDRRAYWTGRQELISILRPNRSIYPGTLRKVRIDGSKRDLNVYILEGPKFVSNDPKMWDEWGFTEPLRFQASNPVAYEPTRNVVRVVSQAYMHVILPMTLPHILGDWVLDRNAVITYLGDWPEYPTIRIHGPINKPTITNLSTGKKLSLDVVLTDTETVDIVLTYGTKTVTKNSGDNYISYLTSDSDLATFCIEPDPVVTGGINTIQVAGTDTEVATYVEIYYYNRYLGY